MKRRRAFGVVLAVAAGLAVAGFAMPLLPVAPQDQAATSAPPLTASGVIEATVVRLAHEFGGKVEAIYVDPAGVESPIPAKCVRGGYVKRSPPWWARPTAASGG